jgi:hypothetical protein
MLAFSSNAWIDANRVAESRYPYIEYSRLRQVEEMILERASSCVLRAAQQHHAGFQPGTPSPISGRQTESARRETLPVREESSLGRQVGGGIANDTSPGVLGFEVEELHRLAIHG